MHCLAGHEWTGKGRTELVELIGRVAQSMVVSDIVEEFLRVKRTAKEQRERAIGSLDDVRDLVNSFSPIERVLVCESVLHAV